MKKDEKLKSQQRISGFLRYNYGNPSLCIACGKTRENKRIAWSLKDGCRPYSLNIQSYEGLCFSCLLRKRFNTPHKCSELNCERLPIAKGKCKKHWQYDYWKKNIQGKRP
jgi:hypothetical protein